MSPSVHAKQKVVWKETFNGSSINTKMWTVLKEKPYKNKELQTYLPANVKVTNGTLVLTSKYAKGKYTSGAIQLHPKKAFKYGRIEIRAKLPNGRGLFPAFWMMTASGKKLPEIDIMEMLGHEPTRLWMVYHYWHAQQGQQRTYSTLQNKDFSNGYHIYALDWQPKRLMWLIDGKEVFRTNKAPNEKMNLILNTAIGGNWPGRPDVTTWKSPTMKIDWIKVFQ